MPNCVRFIAARVTKVVGNFLKIPCYLFYAISPRSRFFIPHYAKPLWPGRARYQIPKIIWQTNYTDRVTLAVYLNYLFNRLMSPTYEYRFMSPDERAEFIAQYCAPDIVNAYSRLQIGAAQADLWRLLVLSHCGGVYLDIDAHIVWPLGFVIEPAYRELYLEHKDGRLTNYFIASAPGNPHLDLVIDSILSNISNVTTNDVAELTGPPVLDRSIKALNVPTAYYKYTCYQGSFTNEFFQYVDHPEGKWFRTQNGIALVKR